MTPLGLIAGEGVFPMLVARGARAAGRKVVCAALAGTAWPALRDECDEFSWVGVLRFNKWLRVLKSAGCDEAILVGRVAKSKMYDRWRYFRYIPDWRAARMWFRTLRHDNGCLRLAGLLHPFQFGREIRAVVLQSRVNPLLIARLESGREERRRRVIL